MQHYNERLAYCIYVTDTLYLQAQEKRFTHRFVDVIRPPKVDTRSGDEIAAEVIARAGLRIE